MASRTKALRCAIYTRKSSEEGLEQDFNSLDAQREACEAYIKSQRQEGWIVLPDPYDDGGVSGATMERPALKRLLTEIEAGKIDTVVVYKVDRLTRALSDFAKIVEIFDARGVSFVSVTQQFNTTSSMGRLTLNVLLSFAQFEREVTGERIRDKIAASKKKGMWMGGFVPLGYDARDRKLIVNPGEAEIVRRIFHRYAEIGNIDLIQAELDAEGIRTKERTGKAKARWGERPFTKNGLYRMLQNRIYIGQITHKENSYRGEHKAIIDQDLWDRVQQRLNGNRIQRRNGASAKEASLLAGLLYDEQGRRLTPSHATKGSRRYRYYVTPTDPLATSSPNQRAWRLPANEIEELVRLEIIGLLQSTTRLGHVLDLRSATPEDRLRIHQASAARARALKDASQHVVRGFLVSVLERITMRNDAIDLEIHPSRLKAAILREDAEGPAQSKTIDDEVNELSHCIRIDTRLKRCGGEIRLVLLGDDQQERLPKPDPNLIWAMANAHSWARQLIAGEVASITEIAKRNDTSRSRASSILTLAFLAPDIVEAILDGRQPPEVNLELLTGTGGIPLSWVEQRRLYGTS
jgi:DNA invertase Pin-like site-specific DNA recombinase